MKGLKFGFMLTAFFLAALFLPATSMSQIAGRFGGAQFVPLCWTATDQLAEDGAVKKFKLRFQSVAPTSYLVTGTLTITFGGQETGPFITHGNAELVNGQAQMILTETSFGDTGGGFVSSTQFAAVLDPKTLNGTLEAIGRSFFNGGFDDFRLKGPMTFLGRGNDCK